MAHELLVEPYPDVGKFVDVECFVTAFRQFKRNRGTDHSGSNDNSICFFVHFFLSLMNDCFLKLIPAQQVLQNIQQAKY